MFDLIDIRSSEPLTDDPAGDADALAIVALQLGDLAEMRALAMSLLRKIEHQAGKDRRGSDPILAFARISRAVRLTIMLEQEILGLRKTRQRMLQEHQVRIVAQAMHRLDTALAADTIEPPRSSRKISPSISRDRGDYETRDDCAFASRAELVTHIAHCLDIAPPDLSIWQETLAPAGGGEIAYSPRPSGEREGPSAKRWEGEGAASGASLIFRQQSKGTAPSPGASRHPLPVGARVPWLRRSICDSPPPAGED